MRRLCLMLLTAVLAAPAAAVSAGLAAGAAGDGSLVVSDASGTFVIQGKGLIFGHFDQGALIVVDYKADDPTTALTVSGPKGRVVHSGATYSGTDVRFLLPSGRYTIRLVGLGVAVSAVGKGNVSLIGAGSADDGLFAVNGARPQPVPPASAGQAFGVASTVKSP